MLSMMLQGQEYQAGQEAVCTASVASVRPASAFYDDSHQYLRPVQIGTTLDVSHR